MKRKYIIIAIAVLVGAVVSSCTDFLDEEAKGTLTPTTFLKNEAEANLVLNGLQVRMTGPGNYGHCGTDIGTSGRDLIAGGWATYFYQHNVATTSGTAGDWSKLYQGIRDVNLLIDGVNASSVLSDEVKGSTIAQALFYRAVFYFELTTIWGDVPYWRDEIDMTVVAPLGTTEASIIQEEMIADLETAITSGYLSEKKWNENGGRPTVWAARMLKAHYHIWMEQWGDAITELTEVTTNSPHPKVLPPYGEQYKVGNELHDEVIFGREFLIDVLGNGSFQFQSHPNKNGENANANAIFTDLGIFNSSSLYVERWSFANSYDSADLRKPYNCYTGDTLRTDSTTTFEEFNWVYIPKLMGCALPNSDPLWPENMGKNQVQHPIRLFKISDAYLLLAEAEFMENGSTSIALDAINTVRTRAGLADLGVLTLADIQQERAWELPAEGFFGRKRDLIRWGILESTVMALPQKERDAGAYSLGVTRAMDDSTQIANAPTGRYRVMPINAEQISISEQIGGALEQTPIWVD